MANITFLPVTGKISIAGVKEILLNQNFQNTVVGVYNKNPEVINYKNSNSIKDVISSTFSTPSIEGASTQTNYAPAVETTTPAAVTPTSEVVSPSVTISPIPAGSNDLSKEPVNMSFNPSLTPEPVVKDTTVEIKGVNEETNDAEPELNITSLDALKSDEAPAIPETQEVIQNIPENSSSNNAVNEAISSGELKNFGGNSSTNIFDAVPGLGISETEINNPNLSEMSEVDSIQNAVNEITSQPETPKKDSIFPTNVTEPLNTLNEMASKDNGLKSLLLEYIEALAASAENKIKSAEIDKNIAAIVNKIASTLENKKENEIDINSGATLLNDNNTLNEHALDQVPSEIMPFQNSVEEGAVLGRAA